MNWLIRLADKASFLKQKYLTFALKKLLPTMPPDSPQNNKELEVEKRLVQTIDHAMQLSKKYAEWYLYQALLDIEAGGALLSGFNFGQVRDWLQRGNGMIPSLKTTPEEVMAMSNQWHTELAARETQYQTHNVIATLSDDFQLVEVSAEDAQAEGYHMGHCVGSYCDEIKSGNLRIFSLRDAKNDPHVTIEAEPVYSKKDGKSMGALSINQMKGKENFPQPKYVKYVEEMLDALMKVSPITFDAEGWSDYTGFQEDPNFSNQRIRTMMENTPPEMSDELHESPIFKLYQLGKTPPNNEVLWEYLQTGDMDGSDVIQNNSSTLYDYIVRINKEHLEEEAKQLLERGEITEDEYEDFDGGEGITDNQRLQSLVNGLVEMFGQEEDEIRAYLMEEHEDDVIEHYIRYEYADEFPSYDDPYEQYSEWNRTFRREEAVESRKQHQERIVRILNEYNIVIPDNVSDDVWRRARYLPFEATDEQWATELQSSVNRRVQEQARIDQSWGRDPAVAEKNWLQRTGCV